jgi:hypothetical protein
MLKPIWIVAPVCFFIGQFIGWSTATVQNKTTMPTCPVAEGKAVIIEYYKDGSMVCTYQQLPAGVKTYKQEHK